jgi:hypothetical protein
MVRTSHVDQDLLAHDPSESIPERYAIRSFREVHRDDKRRKIYTQLNERQESNDIGRHS